MKNFYLRKKTAFSPHGIKALQTLFLAIVLSIICYHQGFAQVTVTPANNTSICSSTAASGGTAPSCTALGTITIAETATNDFIPGPDNITLVPPPGWQFCTSPAPTIGSSGTDITAGSAVVAPGFSSTSITIAFNVTGITSVDQITITGLMVQPLTTTSPNGNITASSDVGVPTLVVGPGGTNFATLGEIPLPITSSRGSGFAVCQGMSDTLTSSPGVTWSSSNSFVANIGSTSGIITTSTAPTAYGSVVITATLSGCSVTVSPYTVNQIPPPITGPAFTVGSIHNLCAYTDTESLHDALTSGVYSSTLVTDTTYMGTGLGIIHAHGPGVATITYTLPTGCSTSIQITVNPQPAPIATAPYQVCVGSTDSLTDASGGGTWSHTGTRLTINSSTGLLMGVAPGVDTVIYTLTTGCKTDTPFTVYANPVISSAISPLELCALSTTTVTATPSGGTWASSVSSVAGIGISSGIITAGPVSTVSTSVITYTSPVAGCQSNVTVTVDPLPGAITGPSQVCVGSTITLSSTTPGGAWTSSNPSVGTIDPSTGVIGGIAPGVIVIVYTIMPGSCTASFVVTVNPIPPMPTGIPAGDRACADPGRAYTLSDAVTPGTWSSSNSSIATIVSGTGALVAVSPGVTTICYTASATGCQICFDFTVDPIPSPISGKDTFCADRSPYTFSSATPSPPATWSSSDPSRGPITATGSFTPIAAGPAITITLTSALGCSTSISVTIDPVPPHITDAAGAPGGFYVCQGQSILLMDALPGGVWTSADTNYFKVNPVTGLVTAGTTLTGTQKVIYTGAGGCDTMADVTVLPTPSITVTVNPICQGQTEVITASSSSGVTFPWAHTRPQGTVDSLIFGVLDSFATLKALAGGMDTIYYTLGAGTNSCTSSVVVTVNPILPITSTRINFCVGDTITFTDPVPGGVWSNLSPGAGSIDPATGHYVVLGPGTDVIEYSIPSTGCSVIYPINNYALPTSLTGPNTICAMSTATFVGSPSAGTYANINPTLEHIDITSGFDSAYAGPGGVDTIYYTINYVTLPPFGCSISTTVTVEPLSPIIASGTFICYSTDGVTDSLSFVDRTLGGTWSVANPAEDSINLAGVFKPKDTLYHVDTIYYTMPSGCQAMATATVFPIPTAIVGKDTICQGDTTLFVSLPAPPAGLWSGGGSVASVSATGTITGLNTGVAVITYSLLPMGCYVTHNVTVDANPAPIIGIHHACLNRDTTLLDATPGGVWTTTQSAISTVTAGGRVHGVGLGVDSVYYTLPTGGCRVLFSFTVNPIPIVTVTPNPTPIKCKYAPVTLIAKGADSDPTDSMHHFVWTPSYGLSTNVSTSASPNVIATPTITTTYTVVGTSDEWGCDSFTTVTVFVDSQLNHMQIVGKDSICVGECDLLQASGRAGTFFDWHPAAGLSCTICDTTNACPNVTTKYWAVAIDDIGCKDSVSFTVTVNPLPVVVVDPNPPIVCKGRPLQVHAHSPNTEPPTDMYVWTPNLFISCDTCYNPILTDTSNLVYQVTAFSQYGCHDSLNVKVTVLDTNVNHIVSDTNICVGDSALLIASSHSLISNLNIPTFTWMPTTGLSAPDSNVTFANPAVTTTYSLAIHQNACFTDTLKVTVFVQPYPAITITTNVTGNEIVAGTPVQFAALVKNTPVATYVWTPGSGLTCDSCFNPEVVVPTVSTTYTVTVTSVYGCTSVDTITLHQFCDQSQIFVPNTFTPNGDGVNDLFYVSAKGITLINLMQVYNRWGQLVFEARNIPPNDPGKGWDGTFKGLVLEPDVFVYIIKAQCQFGQKFDYTGDISLIR